MRAPDEDFPAYIARCKCGCTGIVVAIVDNPKHKKETAKEVASCIKDNFSIERVTVGYVRSNRFGCLKKKERNEHQRSLEF